MSHPRHYPDSPHPQLTDGDGTSSPADLSRELAFDDSFQTGQGLMIMTDGDLQLPEPTLNSVETIEQRVRELSQGSGQVKERFVEWLLRTGYIKLLIDLFNDAEDLEQLPVLHCLCSIMQNIRESPSPLPHPSRRADHSPTAVLLNDNVLFEHILQDDVFLGVVGMLEYDPVFPRDKASFRAYLSDPARFRQVVPIPDKAILAKIHHTYRLHYLKDVILARIMEDATFSILQSIAFFYQVEIINYCSGNEQFLASLFSIFENTSQNDEGSQKIEDGVMFLQQLCSMGKTIQLPARMALYHTLVQWGLIDVIEWALSRGDVQLRNAAAEMLMLVIEYDANNVRMHILNERDKKVKTLMSVLIDLLHAEGDMGLKAQIVEVLRILLDCADGPANGVPNAFAQSLDGKQRADPERFLTSFYEDDANHLFAPIQRLPDVSQLPKNSRLPPMPLGSSALFGHLCDLLSFITANHAFRSQYFVITSEISRKVASLLRSRDKYLRCATTRFFKACLANNNQFTNRHHIKMDLFAILLGIVEEEADKDNLVASACINYFDYMRKESMNPLINHIIERCRPKLEVLARHPSVGKTFEEMLSIQPRSDAAKRVDDSFATQGSLDDSSLQ